MSFPSQKKGRSGCAFLLAALCLLLLTTIVAKTSVDASSNPEIHAAATSPRRVVRPKAPSRVEGPKTRARVLLPVVDQSDIRPEHQDLADRVLRALPHSCRDSVQNFYVLYGEKGKNRGLGGESTIIVTGNVKGPEFMALMTHECGHVADLGGLKGSPSAGTSGFVDGGTHMYADDPSVAFYALSWDASGRLRKDTKERDFVSGYALSDEYEDFAETYAYYALQRKEFKRLAAKNPVLKAKYDFMEQVVFADTPQFADGQHTRGKRAPWDVTKLPYVWNPAPRATHAKK